VICQCSASANADMQHLKTLFAIHFSGVFFNQSSCSIKLLDQLKLHATACVVGGQHVSRGTTRGAWVGGGEVYCLDAQGLNSPPIHPLALHHFQALAKCGCSGSSFRPAGREGLGESGGGERNQKISHSKKPKMQFTTQPPPQRPQSPRKLSTSPQATLKPPSQGLRCLALPTRVFLSNSAFNCFT
jgi:hypothetical protein